MPDLSIRGALVLIDAYLATDPGEWHPYVNPAGEQMGWQNSKTGRVIYQDERPGVEGAGEPPLRTSGAKPKRTVIEQTPYVDTWPKQPSGVAPPPPTAPPRPRPGMPSLLDPDSKLQAARGRLHPDVLDRVDRTLQEYHRLISDPENNHPLNRPNTDVSLTEHGGREFYTATGVDDEPLSAADHFAMAEAHSLAGMIAHDMGNLDEAATHDAAVDYHNEQESIASARETGAVEIVEDEDDLMSPEEREQQRIEAARKRGEESAPRGWGTTEGYESPLQADQPLARFASEHGREAAQKLFGPEVTEHQIRGLFADPEDTDWKVSIDGYVSTVRPSLSVSLSHPNVIACSRTISKDRDGRLYMYSDINRLKKTGGGFGSKFFARQVEGCRKNGIAYIKNMSARGASYNGYITWPKLGYNAPLDEDHIGSRTLASVRENFPDAESVLDVLASPGGKKWWEDFGSSIEDNRFDCSSDDTRSMQVLRAYLEEKASQPPKPNLSLLLSMPTQQMPPSGDEIDLSPEDEAALERAWAKIQARWSANPALAPRIRPVPRPISPAALSILLTTQPSNWKPHKGQDGKQAGWQNLTTGEIVYESVRPGRPDTSQPPPETSGPHPTPPVARKPRHEPAPLPSGRKVTQLRPPAPPPQPQPSLTLAQAKMQEMIDDFEQHPKVKPLLEGMRQSEARLAKANDLPPMKALEVKGREFYEQQRLAKPLSIISRQFFLNSCKLVPEKRASLQMAKPEELDPDTEEIWSAAHNFFSHIIGKDGLGDQVATVKDVLPQDRNQTSHYDTFSGVIYLDQYATPGIAAHEFGHQLEADDWASQRVQNFRQRRFPKEKDVDLNQLYPGDRFAPGTMGNPDQLEGLLKVRNGFAEAGVAEAYAGRTYPSLRQTEILSTGLQLLYEDPVAFAKKDPEYFSLVMSILQDDRRSPP